MHARRWLMALSVSASLHGFVNPAPAAAQERPAPRPSARPATPRAELFAASRGGAAEARPGREAPDFGLPLLEGSRPPADAALDAEGNLRLSRFQGKRPVVLIFGSYT